MSSNLNSVLSQAYGLIEADQHDEAVRLLRPLLAEYPNNADAWWLYAHAVTNVDDARAALETVLTLDPNYPDARTLMDQLEEVSSDGIGGDNPLQGRGMLPIRTIPDLPETAPEADLDDIPDFGKRFDEDDTGVYKPTVEVVKKPGFPWLRVGALALLFIVALVAALLLSQNVSAPGDAQTLEPGADRTGTAVVLNATDQAFEAASTPEAIELTATAIVAGASSAPEATGDATGTGDAGTAEVGASTEEPEGEPDSLLQTATAIARDATTQAGGAGTEEPEGDLDPLLLTATAIIADVTAQAGGGAETAEPGAEVTAEAASVGDATADAGGGAETAEAASAGDATAVAGQGGGEGEATPTQEVLDTSPVVNLEPIASAFQAEFGEGDVQIEQTDRGQTLMIRLCSDPLGVTLRNTLSRAVNTLSGQGNVLQFGIDGVGFRLVECPSERVLRTLTADIDAVSQFAGGTLTAAQFEAGLQPE